MLIQDRTGTVNFLIECLNKRSNNPKAVAYILGQIGDKKALDSLWHAISIERTIGNKEAMEASAVAIEQAPADEGYTELQRREIIDAVYYKKPFSKPELDQNTSVVNEVNKIETTEDTGKAQRLVIDGFSISYTFSFS